MKAEKKIGRKILKLRRFAGLTQTEVAEQISISQPLMAQIEKGNRKIKEEKLEELCQFYSITIEDFRNKTMPQLYEKIWLTVKKPHNAQVSYTDIQGNNYQLTLN